MGADPVVGVDAYAVGAFVGYLALIVGIGVYAARFSSKGISEFFVAGRRMGRFVVALSAVVSGRSAWLLLGLSGTAYTMGIAAIWAAAGYIVVEFLLFLFYAPRLRRFSGVYDCITVLDFFAARFGDRNGRLRMALAGVFLIFLIAYVSSQFVGGGKAIATSFQLEPTTGIFLTAGVVLAYTILGGFLAVSLTDTVQGILMLSALLLLPLLVTLDLGGPGAVYAQVIQLDPLLASPFALTFGAWLGFVGIGLGSPGNPHILVRYMSIADAKDLRYAAFVGTGWNVLMALGAVFLGLVARIYMPEVELLPAADPENVFPFLAERFLPALIFGLVVAAIFAAIMSTADSQLLVMTSTLIRDVYQQVWRRGEELPQRQLVLHSRAMVVALVALALGFGLLAEELIFWLVLFAWAGLGAALGPTSILALFWRGTTRAGIFAGLTVGTVTAITWYLTPALRGFVYELIPAFFLALAATVLVSRITRPPTDTDEMFDVMAGRTAHGLATPAPSSARQPSPRAWRTRSRGARYA